MLVKPLLLLLLVLVLVLLFDNYKRKKHQKVLIELLPTKLLTVM